MSELDQALRDLVIGNRILAHQNVVDGYGHISIRHPSNPEHFLLSRSRSPELVVEADIMEFTLDGKVVGDDRRPPYLERFIHGGLYEARPDVHAVVHSHAEDTLAFGITDVPLQPVIHVARSMGPTVPVWDIARTIRRRHQPAGHQCRAGPRPGQAPRPGLGRADARAMGLPRRAARSWRWCGCRSICR